VQSSWQSKKIAKQNVVICMKTIDPLSLYCENFTYFNHTSKMKNTRSHLIALGIMLICSIQPIMAQNGLRWVQFSGSLPSNTVYGGQENGRQLPVCRCDYNGGTHPGKVVGNNCNIGWGGKEIVVPYFDILLNDNAQLSWRSVSGGSIPAEAFIAGYENGNPMYVGKGDYAGGVHPGKIFYGGGRYILNIGYGGKEITLTDFQVLIPLQIASAPSQTEGPAELPASPATPAGTTTTVSTNNSPTTDCAVFSGHYLWHDNQFYSLKADGSFGIFKGPTTGKWNCNAGKFRVIWDNGVSEQFVVNADGTFTGSDNNGRVLSIRKATKSEVDALKIQKQVGDLVNDAMKKKKN
jgi:hypothetical protein